MQQTLNVYEVFSSIQGESSFAGLPCFFIRLAGCNLRCAYCDTKKALSAGAGVPRTIESLLADVRESRLNLVEITGGEPLLQAGTPALCRALIDEGCRVLIESNGSLDASVLPDEVIRILDIKTPSSGEETQMFAANFTSLRPCDEVKFVISSREDYLYARKKIAEFALPSQISNILLSPAFAAIDTAKIVEWMLEDHLPARINLQFHKYIWGPEREGV